MVWTMWPPSRPRLLGLLGLVSACQNPHADTSPFTTTPPMTSASGSSSSTDTSSSTSGSDSGGHASSTLAELSTSTSEVSTSAGGTTLVLDVGSDQDVGPLQPVGCKGKIDFLFVISRYAGMGYFQDQLLAAFPAFIETIEDKFSDFDYHIMVVDGDPEWGSVTCDGKCPTQCEPNYPCGYAPTTCDTTMGAGVVYPAGFDATNALCPIAGGRRYMAKGQTDLKDTFLCVARIGSSGRDRLGEALTAAMLLKKYDPGDCNTDFLRDDALLMITLMSNTYDDPEFSSKGTPGDWAAAVREAKGGDLNSVVLLNIGGTLVPGCHKYDRLCQMAELFPYALTREITGENYGAYFKEATGLVEKACEEFIPPG
jgi:hypothetical protein